MTIIKIIKIKEISLEKALQWENCLGVIGILGCRQPEKAVAVFDGDQIVAVATVGHGWLIGLVVDPAHRRHGIGRRLFIETFEVLKKMGYDSIRTEPCSAGGWALVKKAPAEVLDHLRIVERF